MTAEHLESSSEFVAVERYSGLAIGLHWVLGVALVGLFSMGLYMAELPVSPLRLKLFNWHKWAGICVLVL